MGEMKGGLGLPSGTGMNGEKAHSDIGPGGLEAVSGGKAACMEGAEG